MDTKTHQPAKTDLTRAIEKEKAAKPHAATLDLQQRPRVMTPRKLKSFLRIARGRKS